jgi:hypothetical protein
LSTKDGADNGPRHGIDNPAFPILRIGGKRVDRYQVLGAVWQSLNFTLNHLAMLEPKKLWGMRRFNEAKAAVTDGDGLHLAHLRRIFS